MNYRPSSSSPNSRTNWSPPKRTSKIDPDDLREIKDEVRAARQAYREPGSGDPPRRTDGDHRIGVYFLSLEKALIDTLGQSWEAETHKVMLDSDTDTPNFDTHDFRNDVVTEVTGTNWAAGGVTLTGTEITMASGTLTFDATDVSVASTTITRAMASIFYTNVGVGGHRPADHAARLRHRGVDVGRHVRHPVERLRDAHPRPHPLML